MDLDEVLLEQRKISQLLDGLLDAHRRALSSDVQENDQLDRIRKDILICLNDLRTLNSLIIDSKEGLVKKGLNSLQKSEAKLKDLEKQEKEIQSDLNSWDSSEELKDKRQEEWSSISVNIVGNHRSVLNRYIEEIGIENTSLAGDDVRKEELSLDLKKEDIQKNVKMLENGKEQVESEIDQLRSLLSEYEKDRKIITNELERNRSMIRHSVNSLTRDKEAIINQRRKILKKVGLLKEKEKASIFSLNTHSISSDPDYDIALSQAHEFIDAKKKALQQILQDSKNQKPVIDAQFSSWKEAVNLVQDLEISLQDLFISSSGNVSKSAITTMIEQTVSKVEINVVKNLEGKIGPSINREIEALKQAINELSEKPKPITTAIPVRTPELLNLGKSPPKVGLSIENASQRMMSSNNSLSKVNKSE